MVWCSRAQNHMQHIDPLLCHSTPLHLTCQSHMHHIDPLPRHSTPLYLTCRRQQFRGGRSRDLAARVHARDDLPSTAHDHDVDVLRLPADQRPDRLDAAAPHSGHSLAADRPLGSGSGVSLCRGPVPRARNSAAPVSGYACACKRRCLHLWISPGDDEPPPLHVHRAICASLRSR